MADPRKDLKLIENDIAFINNDLNITFSDEQHVIDTINAYPGWWKENVLDGVGVNLILGGPSTDNVLLREVKLQLDSDGYDTAQLRIARDEFKRITIYPNATLR